MVLGLGWWGLGVGPTAALRLGAWGAAGLGLAALGAEPTCWADGDDVRGPGLL